MGAHWMSGRNGIAHAIGTGGWTLCGRRMHLPWESPNPLIRCVICTRKVGA